MKRWYIQIRLYLVNTLFEIGAPTYLELTIFDIKIYTLDTESIHSVVKPNIMIKLEIVARGPKINNVKSRTLLEVE